MDPNKIAHDIRNDLSNKRQYHGYYDFVKTYLASDITDPFVTHPPPEKAEDLHIERDNVNLHVLEKDFRILVGKKGCGKTTFLKRYNELKKLPYGALRLGIIVDSVPPEQDWKGFLAHHIFKVYQRRLLDPFSEIASFLPDFVRNSQWRNTFHNLCFNCQIKQWEQSGNGLLTCESMDLFTRSRYDSTSADILSELCHFIVYPVTGYNQNFGGQTEWPYQKIQVFLDFADSFAPKAILDSINDLQPQSDDDSQDRPDIKVFIEQKQRDLIGECSLSKVGPVYHFPPWRREELNNFLLARFGILSRRQTLREKGIPEDVLRQLRQTLSRCDEFKSNEQLQAIFVDRRIAGWRNGLPETYNLRDRVNFTIDYLFNFDNHKGENILFLFLYVLSECYGPYQQLYRQLRGLADNLTKIPQCILSPMDFNWLNIPTNHLKYTARPRFIQIIVNGALRAYTHPTEFDAPIHALKLARGLIAACAGCWLEHFPPPLNAHQLQQIVDLYWEEERSDG